jgi:hypothetical protein
MSGVGVRPFMPCCLRLADRVAAVVAASLAAVLAAAFVPTPAAFAQDTVRAPGFLLNRFSPALAGSRFFAVDTAGFSDDPRVALRLGFDLATRPFVFENADRDASGAIVARQSFFHMGVAATVLGRVRLGLDVPLLVESAGTASPPVGRIVYPAPGEGELGDLRTSANLRVLGEAGDAVVLALGLHVFWPVGTGQYTSDDIVRVQPRALVSGNAGPFVYAAEIAFLSRDHIAPEWFSGFGIGHELILAAALGVTPVEGVFFGAELVSATKLTDGDWLKKRSTPTELMFGAHFDVFSPLRFALGAGPGITPTKGTPEMRFVARLEWQGGSGAR